MISNKQISLRKIALASTFAFSANTVAALCLLPFFVTQLFAQTPPTSNPPTAPATAHTPLCEKYQPPKEYVALKEKLNQRIEVFANKKPIAEQADALLSKLLTAKSPVIISWINKRDLSNKNETEIVKTWRLYFARNFILTKYPHNLAKVDQEIEKLVDDTLKENISPKFISKLEGLFTQTQKTALETIEKFEFTDPIKKEILDRIKPIRLYWPKNLKSSRNNAIPLDLIDWGIAYDPVSNAINIGINALSYLDDETFISVFAHEIGHSIDSCRWSSFFKNAQWPFETVGECLRSMKSVAALKRDDSALDKQDQLSPEVKTSLKQNPTCNKLLYPPAGMQADQLPEAFADWFSAEVLGRTIDIKVENIRRDLCEVKTLMSGSSYPENSSRLELIYWAQPMLRTRLDLEKSAAYCSFERATK